MTFKEGQEWTDDQFNYLAYRKGNGNMAIRDVEGFDYSEGDWRTVLKMDMPPREVDDDLTPEQRVARWEAALGPLPR